MPLNFPNSPSLNDFFVAGGRRWQWNGTAWQRIPDPGAQGVQGNQGNTGPTGAQGAQGHQGATAAAGAQGAQGSAGSNGSAGAQGAQGVNGNFGGASFEYTYLTNTTDSDPGAGSLKFNNANLTSASILYIDDTDGGSSNTDIQPFLRTIDDSTSTIKGHVKVSTKTNPDQFVLYTIASLTEATGYFKVTVAYVSGSVTSFTNSSDVSITFARTGDAGSTGAQGAQGVAGGAGAQGAQGNQGTAAGLTISTGAPGSPSAGDLWWDSDDGDLHTYYNDGNSSQWVAINVGPMGAQGSQGHQGQTGSGAQGAQGHQGAAGAAGAQGAQGHQGAQGAQGHQGAGGSAGSAGAQGAQGHQGAVGAQGDDASLSMSTGAPSSPDAGDLWFDTDSGILSAYYADGSSNQWVEVSTGPKGDTGAQGAQGAGGSNGTNGAQGAQGNAGAQGAQGSAGSATISSNANDRIITGGSGTNLVGESTFTFDGTKVHLNAGSTSHIQIDGTASYLQVAGVKVWMGAGNRSHNTAVGNGALASASGGDDCTAVGHNAYANGTSGEDNTVVGSHAMDAVVTGNHNCAFGHASLTSLTSGYNNSCYGRTSGFALLNGHNNTFLGYDCGNNTTSGSYNIFAGAGAGKYETTSADNVAIGYHCFGGERSGGNSNQFNKNTVLGHQALAQQRISNGDGENVCIGYRAMYNVTTGGWRNCIVGYQAGYTQNGASYNTFLGTFAGYNYTSGGNTMCLGYNAGTANSPSGALTTHQDTICLGNDSISNFYCNDTSISSSDARDKTDITEWTHGLSFINQLKPITYRWDKRTWYGTDEEPIGTPDGSKKKARLHLGFLAQDALEVEKSFGYASKKDDMLAVNLNEDESAYGMKYERLVVPLTKAVQELSAEVDALKAEIASLKSS